MSGPEYDGSGPLSESEFIGDELFEESCWKCFGEGGWHECGEDTCCCAEPCPTHTCDICGGRGWL